MNIEVLRGDRREVEGAIALVVNALTQHARRRDLLDDVRRHGGETELRRLCAVASTTRGRLKDAGSLGEVTFGGLLYLLHRHCDDALCAQVLLDILVTRASSKGAFRSRAGTHVHFCLRRWYKCKA